MGEMVVDSYNHDGYLTTSDGKLDDHYAAFLRNSAERDEQAELWLAVDSEHILGCVTWCPVGSPYRELATNDQQSCPRSPKCCRHTGCMHRSVSPAAPNQTGRRSRESTFGHSRPTAATKEPT